MANYSKFWKVWLRPNILTQDIDNDYFAEVSTMKNTLRNEDIAKRIVAAGSEIKYDTLVSVFNQRDRYIREVLCDGFSVITGVCRFSPRVSGTWIGENAQFDPLQHQVTLDIVPSIEMRNALQQVGVEVLTVKSEGGARIGTITDTFTGFNNDVATIGEDILIEGNKIRVEGEGEAIGIYFVDADGTATKVTRRLTQNNPSTVIARVPATLKPGLYTLRIVTQYTGGTSLLKEPRTLEYARPLQLASNGE